MSASLVHGTGNYDYLYLGASLENSATSRWHMAIMRIDHSTPTTPQVSSLVYSDGGDCSNSNLGFGDISEAVYIEHLGFMEDLTTGG